MALLIYICKQPPLFFLLAKDHSCGLAGGSLTSVFLSPMPLALLSNGGMFCKGWAHSVSASLLSAVAAHL